MLRQLVLVAFLVGTAFAGPTDRWYQSESRSQCSPECSSGYRYLNYEPGKTYVYKYEAKIGLPTTDDHLVVDLAAGVHISVYQQCELAMQFRDVQLKGLSPDDQPRFQEAIEAEPVIFHFEDGQIMGICPGKEQPEWVTNIARGFLSAFQTDIASTEGDVDKYEIDVLGKCYTTYTTYKDRGGGTFIKKEKQMHTCTDRHNLDLAVFPVQFPGYESKEPLFVHSNFRCVQVLKENILKSVSCQDSHYLPLQQNSNGIQTNVRISLQQVEDNLSVRKVSTGPKKSLLFVHEVNDEASSRSDVEKILKELCAQTKNGVEQQAPEVFGELTEALATLSQDDLRSLYQSIKKNLICNTPSFLDLFLDAVASCDSGEAYSFLASLIRSNEVSDLRANMWYLMMSVAKNITEEAIEAFLPTLKTTTSRHALLGISSMIARFCHNSSDCHRQPTVQRAIQALARRLNSQCDTSSEEEETLHLLLLKALGNIGFADQTTENVMECFMNKEASEPVRIAAIDTLRHVPCQPQTWERTLDILSRETETPVIRVAAFLHLMKCPSEDTVKQINTIYQQVRCEQVGSFMYTFLTNLQETSDPMKQGLRSAVSGYYFEERFPGSFTSQSRNYEFSKYFAGNVGLTKDINIVFSEKGIFPRYAATNLTTAAMGYSMNNAEHTYYLKGAEKYIQQMLSQKNAILQFYRNLPDQIKDYIPQEVIESLLQLLSEQIGDSLDEEFDFIVGMRLFGRDISHITAKDIQQFLEEVNGVDLVKILGKIAVRRKVEITRGIQFLNTQVTIPTISGLPIKLKLNGTVVAGLKLRGKADITDAKNGNIDIDFIAEPSFASQIACHASIDTHFANPGLKLNATIHSSFAFGGKVQISKKGLARVALKFPKKLMKLVNVTLNAYQVGQDGHLIIQEPSMNRAKSCFDKLSSILGFEVCVSADIPRRLIEPRRKFLPFNVPISFAVDINKTDITLAGYEVIALWTPEEVDGRKSFVFSLDTPNSYIDRHYAVALHTEKEGQGGKMQILVRTPSGTFPPYSTKAIFPNHVEEREDSSEEADEDDEQGDQRVTSTLMKSTFGKVSYGEVTSYGSSYNQGRNKYHPGWKNPRTMHRPKRAFFEAENEDTETHGIGGPLVITKEQAQQGVKPIAEDLAYSGGKQRELISREMQYLAGNYGGSVYNVSALAVLPPPNLVLELNVTANGTQVVAFGLKANQKLSKRHLEYQGTVRLGFGKHEPTEIEGHLTTGLNLKKNKIELEFYPVYQRDAPFLKGKFIKQGSWSYENTNGDIKVSTDITLKLPFMTARLVGVTAKEGRSFFFNNTVEYKFAFRRPETANLNLKVVNMGSEQLTRITAAGELQLSASERYSGKFNWDLQVKPSRSFEATLQFCSQYQCDMKQKNEISIASKAEGAVRKAQMKVWIPVLFLDYEAVVSVERQNKETKIYGQVKKNGRKVLEGKFEHQSSSLNPLQFGTNVYLKYYDREMRYQFAHKRYDKGFIQRILIQWEAGKSLGLLHEYRWEKVSHLSSRHTYRASLSSTSFSGPIEFQAILEENGKQISIESALMKEGKLLMNQTAIISFGDPCHLQIKIKNYEILADAKVKGSKKYLNIDARPTSEDMPRYKMSVTFTDESSERHYLVDFAWDADRQPNKKVYLELHVSQRSSDRVNVSVSAEFSDKASFYLDLQLHEDKVCGPHKLQIALGNKGRVTEIGFVHEIRDGKAKSFLYLRDSGDEKLRLEMNGKYRKSHYEWDLQGQIKLMSKVPQIEDFNINVQLSRKTKQNVGSFTGHISCEMGSSRNYGIQLEYSHPESYGQGQYNYHVAIQTPHRKYQRLEASATTEWSNASVQSSIELTINSQILVAIRGKAEKYLTKYVGELQIQTDCTKMKQISLRVEGDRYKSVQCQLQVNGIPLLNFKAHMYGDDQISGELDIQIGMSTKIKVELQSLHHPGSPEKKYELQVMKNGKEILKIEISYQYDRSQRRSMLCTATVHGKKFLTAHVTNGDSGQEFDIKVEQISQPFGMKGVLSGRKEKGELHLCPLEGYGKCLDVEAEWDSKARSTDVRLKAGAELDLQLHAQVKEENDVTKVDVQVSKDGEQISLHAVHRENEDGCGIDAVLKHSRRAFGLKARQTKLNDRNRSKRWRIELVPLEEPKKKMSAEVIYSGVPYYVQNCDFQADFSLEMPGWKKPAHLALGYNRNVRSERPVEIKASVDLPSGTTPKLLVEAYTESERTKPTETAYALRIYDTERKWIDTSVKVITGHNQNGRFVKALWSYLNRSRQTKSGSTSFTINRESRQIEFFYRILDRDLRIDLHWNKRSPGQWAIESKIYTGSWVGSPSFILQKNASCIYVMYQNETGRNPLVFSYCVGLSRTDILNITLASHSPYKKPISLAEIVVIHPSKGSFTFKFRFPIQHIAELLDMPSEVMQLIKDTQIEEFPKELKRQLQALKDYFCAGLCEPTQETLKELMPIVAEEIISLTATLYQITNRITFVCPYLTGLKEGVQDALQVLLMDLAKLMYTIGGNIRSCLKDIRDAVEGIEYELCGREGCFYQAQQKYQQCVERLVDVIEVIKRRVSEDVKQLWQEAFEPVLGNYMDPCCGNISNLIRKVHEFLCNKIFPLCSDILPPEIMNVISEIYGTISSALQDVYNRYVKVQLVNITEQLCSSAVANAISEALKDIRRAVKEIGSEWYTENVVRVLKRWAKKAFYPIEFPSYQVNYSPERGELTAKLKLPIDSSSVRQKVAYVEYVLKKNVQKMIHPTTRETTHW